MTPRPGSVRVVFDCMVFLQAAGRPQSPARACANLVERGELILCIDHTCLDEVRQVFARPAVRAKFPQLDPGWPDVFVEHIRSFCEFHEQVSEKFHYSRDPKDEKYLNLCHAAKAEFLVTRDRDLLDLMHSQDSDAAEFRAHCPDLRVVTPEELLTFVRTRPPHPPKVPPAHG